MTVTIELTAEEENRLRGEVARLRQAPEVIVHGLVRVGLGAEQTSSEASLIAPSPESLLAKPISEEAHAALIRNLLAEGILSRVPDQPGHTVPFTPITVRGEPVSETIIRERG